MAIISLYSFELKKRCYKLALISPVRIITVLLSLAISSAYASQGVVLLPTETLNFAIPNQVPYSTATSTRIELRIHAGLQPQDVANVVSVPGMQLRLAGPGNGCALFVNDWLDNFAPGVGNGLCVNVPGWTDMLMRVQRDAVAGNLTVQVWDADGTGQPLSWNLPMLSLGSQPLPTQAYIGDAETNCVLDYVRWFSSTVNASVSPFNSTVGDLADFEFEGTLADTSPQNEVITPSGPPTYTASPIYAPLASQGVQRVLKAGVPAILDASGSSSLNGSPTLSYQWAQVSGPTQLQWSSTSTVNPSITGLVFGSYQLQLTVTDSSGQSSSNTLKYGAVFTTPNDVVIPPQGYVTSILGPMLRLGASPWPYFDTSNVAMANFFGGLQSSDYLDVWNNAQPGTINVINGGTSITGTGTTFISTFCGGGNTAVTGATLIVGYPVPNAIGQWGRAPLNVISCQSDTALTVAQPYFASPNANALNFAAMNNTQVATWINGSSNANYYDNVMAFYSLYYRSGIDDYLTYARTLADRWYTMPWFDQGRASLLGTTTLFPRMQAITGLVLRALDGHPEYWTGIEQYLVYDYGFANAPPTAGIAMGDIREQGYATAFLALAALYDPNPVSQALFKTQVETVLSNVWAVAVQPAGNWMNASYGYATWNGNGGTVTVTSNSTTVIGNGTVWQPSWFGAGSVWTADTNGVTDGDPISYTATYISPTQLQLNIPYQGATNSARGWQTNSLVGVGTQPFMLGVVGNSFRYSYLATGDSRIPGYLNGLQNWLATQGYRPDSRGLWYGRVFPNCEPIAVTNLACSGGTVEPSRFLAGETVGAISAAYLSNGNPATAAFGDNIYGAMFGGPTGGPDSDSTYITDVAPGGWAMQNKLSKDFGFFFGFGGGASWPAARLGASAQSPGAGCSFSLDQSAGAVPNSGGSGTINVTASDPNCAWTATSTNPAVVITSGAASSGTGTAGYSVVANAGQAPQSFTVAVADQSFTINQSGVSCSLTLTPASATALAAGGSGTINIAANAISCGWAASSNVSWISISAGATGIGNGTVTYAVAANTGTGTRTGTLTVAGQSFTVAQNGVICAISLGSLSVFTGSAGGSGVVAVNATAGTCPWTAVSNSNFLSVTAGANGIGNGTVSYTVLANPTALGRVGTLTIGGNTFTITQASVNGYDSDIGQPQAAGSAAVSNAVYTVNGAGLAIWGTSDQFNFDTWQASGNATLTARLTSLSNKSALTKAGVMIRQSLAPNSAYAYALSTPTMSGSQSRLSAGASSTYAAGSNTSLFPIWLRVSLLNGVLTEYTSPDGKTWKPVGTPQTIAMAGAYFGLAVTSQTAAVPATAVFDNVTITQP